MGESAVVDAGNPIVVALSCHTIDDELILVLSLVSFSQPRQVQREVSEDRWARG